MKRRQDNFLDDTGIKLHIARCVEIAGDSLYLSPDTVLAVKRFLRRARKRYTDRRAGLEEGRCGYYVGAGTMIDLGRTV